MYAMTEAKVIPNFASADELNPPDVDPMGLLDRGHVPVDLGIGSTYVETMRNIVGSHKAFHEMGALAMIASAIQHRWLPIAYAKRRKMRANLYGCSLGRTSLDHKSTALSKVTETMPWEYMPNCAHLPGLFTEEGLYNELNEHPMGLVVRDEIAVLFASRNRKYTEFVIPFLTELYDGWMSAKRLAGKSSVAREVAVSIFGATTYTDFTNSTSENDWSTGWLVRWLFALPDADYDPKFEPRYPTDYDEAALESFRRRLSDLSTAQPLPFALEPAAYRYITDWRHGLIDEAMADGDRHERVDAIIERYATYAWKFSMILCAAKGDGQTVTIANAKDGVRLAENYMTNLHRLFHYQRSHRLTGALLNKALSILAKNPEGLTRRELHQLLHTESVAMRDAIVEQLLDIGAAIEEKSGRTSRLFATQKKVAVSRVANGANFV